MINKFEARIEELRTDLIEEIITILKRNNITELELSDLVSYPTFVIWFDKNGHPSESRVQKVSYKKNTILFLGYNHETNALEESYSNHDIGAQNIDWLGSVIHNMLETLAINSETEAE